MLRIQDRPGSRIKEGCHVRMDRSSISRGDGDRDPSAAGRSIGSTGGSYQHVKSSSIASIPNPQTPNHASGEPSQAAVVSRRRSAARGFNFAVSSLPRAPSSCPPGFARKRARDIMGPPAKRRSLASGVPLRAQCKPSQKRESPRHKDRNSVSVSD